MIILYSSFLVYGTIRSILVIWIEVIYYFFRDFLLEFIRSSIYFLNCFNSSRDLLFFHWLSDSSSVNPSFWFLVIRFYR